MTKSWVKILNDYRVKVGVSIDGSRLSHDKYRKDFRGNGTYDRVVRGVKILQDELFEEPSSLTVINPEFDGDKIFLHLKELGFKYMDFLFPDNNHNNMPLHPIKSYKDYLLSIFAEWVSLDDPSVTIRVFKSMLSQLLGGNSLVYGFGHYNTGIPLLTVRSDGNISPTDELMSTDPSTVMEIGKNIKSSTLKDVLSSEIFYEIENASKLIPEKCNNCCWYNACGAAGLVSRFSYERRFNNHSVYCDALQGIFAHLAEYLIKNGVGSNIIINNLINKTR